MRPGTSLDNNDSSRALSLISCFFINLFMLFTSDDISLTNSSKCDERAGTDKRISLRVVLYNEMNSSSLLASSATVGPGFSSTPPIKNNAAMTHARNVKHSVADLHVVRLMTFWQIDPILIRHRCTVIPIDNIKNVIYNLRAICSFKI